MKMSNYIQDLGQYEQDLGAIGLHPTVKTIGSSVFGAVKTIGGALASQAPSPAPAPAAAPVVFAPQKPGMPGWVLPVGIGAAALVAILVLRKK